MAGRVMWRQSFLSLTRWLASQLVAAFREKPGRLASQVDAKGSGCTGMVRKVTIQLTNVAIYLESTKKIPKDQISNLNAKLESNPIARRFLKEIVVQHLYFNEVGVREKQRVSSMLGLPMAFRCQINSMKATKT